MTEVRLPMGLSVLSRGVFSWQGGEASGALTGVAATTAEPPSAWVAEVRWRLARVDPESLSDRERIDLIAQLERLKGTATATQARATHAVAESRARAIPQDAARSVGSEIALTRRESPSLGDRFVRVSRALVTELPATMNALTKGAIGERHAVEVVQQSATLREEGRAELDRRLGPVLARLIPPAAGRAARRVAAALDSAAVVRRMEQAAASRRVTLRPAGDGMAYLTVLAPRHEAVGANAALAARAAAVVGGQCPDEVADGRGKGAVMADTATRRMSGRATGQVQPVEVHVVMTDRSLLGTGDPSLPPSEPARIPGHGTVPAPVAREWIRGADPASVWLRRLYTSPDGRDLVAMDSRRRVFPGLLRRMLVLRDDVCSTPWCDGAIRHADHTTPAREDGATTFGNGSGTCARCNHVKEAPGWSARVVHDGVVDGQRGHRPREVELVTPGGHRYRSQAPPLLGRGWQPHEPGSPLEQALAHLVEPAA